MDMAIINQACWPIPLLFAYIFWTQCKTGAQSKPWLGQRPDRCIGHERSRRSPSQCARGPERPNRAPSTCARGPLAWVPGDERVHDDGAPARRSVCPTAKGGRRPCLLGAWIPIPRNGGRRAILEPTGGGRRAPYFLVIDFSSDLRWSSRIRLFVGNHGKRFKIDWSECTKWI